MRAFADLYDTLDSTTSTNAKVQALVNYFRSTPAEDAAWGLFFLTGRRLKRLVPSKGLKQWVRELSNTPEWLFDEAYASVGDLAEIIALLLDSAEQPEQTEELPLSRWMEERIQPLAGLSLPEQRERITGWWHTLPRRELFIFNKMLTGELRVGVSDTLVVRALSQYAELPVAAVDRKSVV